MKVHGYGEEPDLDPIFMTIYTTLVCVSLPNSTGGGGKHLASNKCIIFFELMLHMKPVKFIQHLYSSALCQPGLESQSIIWKHPISTTRPQLDDSSTHRKCTLFNNSKLRDGFRLNLCGNGFK